MRCTAIAHAICTPTCVPCWATTRARRTSPRSPSSAPTGGARPSTTERGSQRGWLFGIARNAALDELRRRSRSAPLIGELPDELAPAPEEEADLAVRRTTVRAALATLPARDRELVALKFHGGLSNAELATLLGTSETNAGTRVHRAVMKLRKACHAPA